MNFQESVDYLYSLGNEVEAMKLGLENIHKLLGALGNPETKYLKVQVAGTNGKGSVCAFLNSICVEGGIKTGLYTSPHLVSVTERVKIDGADISEKDFARLASLVRIESERLVEKDELENAPTYFEQVTAIALAAFAEANVELAILETGLGGRFDAVTGANAEICAITRIDYDHQKQLGETIEEIAAEKAAIIRRETRVAIGAQEPNVLTLLLERCASAGSVPRTECLPTVITKTVNGSAVVEFQTTRGQHWDATLGLRGMHQTENACTAILVAEILADSFDLPISQEQVWLGLENASHPGRLEWIGNVLLDGAHNIGGAKALAAYLEEFVPRPITQIFGAMRDKNVAEIAEILWPRAQKVILTTPQNSRALSPDDLFELRPKGFDATRLVRTTSVREALDEARSNSSSDNTILITGSLYLVGEARELLTRGGK